MKRWKKKTRRERQTTRQGRVPAACPHPRSLTRRIRSQTRAPSSCSVPRTSRRPSSSGNYLTETLSSYRNPPSNRIYVTCSNEMSRMSANLISRKHRINMQRWISTILTFCHQSILWYLFCQLAMLISRLYYYLVHFIAFLDTLHNISRMNFVKQNR